jgi:hypothetical protein
VHERQQRSRPQDSRIKTYSYRITSSIYLSGVMVVLYSQECFKWHHLCLSYLSACYANGYHLVAKTPVLSMLIPSNSYTETYTPYPCNFRERLTLMIQIDKNLTLLSIHKLCIGVTFEIQLLKCVVTRESKCNTSLWWDGLTSRKSSWSLLWRWILCAFLLMAESQFTESVERHVGEGIFVIYDSIIWCIWCI